MQPKTLLRWLLILPYLGWGISLFDLTPIFDLPQDSLLVPLFSLSQIFFLFGIAIWGVPYTTFVIGFWLWSRKQSLERILHTMIYSPLILALLVEIEIVIIFIILAIRELQFPTLEAWGGLLSYCLIAASLSVAFGYVFVGVGYAFYKLSERLGILRIEQEATNGV